MAVNGGAGNPISFSEIRDFYGDSKTEPVSLSEYNRGGDLVPQTFAGSQTATQNTDITYSNNQATFDDFQVNKSTGTTYSQGNVGSRVQRVSVQNGVAFVGAVGSYNVVESDALIFISGTGIRNEGQDVFSTSGTFSTTGVIVDNSSYFMHRIYAGPAYQSGDENDFSGAAYGGPGNLISSSPCSTGTVTATSDSHNNGGTIQIYSARRTATTTFDVTLQNTSSVSTYTLTDDSAGTETVYSPNETATIVNNQLSEGWLVAYDKVTGSGAGSAGDINVSMVGTFINGSIESAADILGGGGSSTAPQRMLFNRQAGSPIINGDRQYGSSSFNFGGDYRSYTVTAADCAISIQIGVGGSADDENPSSNTLTYRINNGSDQTASVSGIATRVPAVQFHGPATPNSTIYGSPYPQPTQTLAAGDVILLKSLAVETIPGSVRVRRRSQSYITRFTNSSGSETYTLEGGSGKTTGIPSGSIDLNPSGTRDVQTTSSSSPSWEIHFDTSSGDCNTNIPTTVGAGNPINMDLFNAPGTPVG